MGSNSTGPPTIAISITETWLKSYVQDAEISIAGFSLFRSDRPERRGGGCALYIKDEVTITKTFTISDRQHSLVLAYSEPKHILFACLYRPPDSEDTAFHSLMDTLQEKIAEFTNGNRSPDIFITGDFNLPLMNWDSCSVPTSPPCKAYQRLMDFINDNFATQVVDQPTRGNNILDLVLTNSPESVANVLTEDVPKLSDHKVVDCILTFNPIPEDPPKTHQWDHMEFRGINIHKGDLEQIRVDLQSVDWTTLLQICEEDGDYEGELFKELIIMTVLQIAIKHCPRKQNRGKTRKSRLEPLKR